MTQGKNIPDYALTNRERVKERLGITDNSHDPILDRYIKSVSDYIQSVTNRNFLYQKYTKEVYSTYGNKQNYLLLNNAPVFTLKLIDVTTVNGSPTISNVANTNGVKVGMMVVGDGIPSGSKVVSCDSTSVTINQNATASTSTAFIAVIGVIEFQYRSGLPSNPSWTDFIPDQFEVLEDGQSGIMRVYGPFGIGNFVNNSIRATYWAGYLIDWENQTDNTKHTLPGDLTMLADDLVCRQFTRRKNAGKLSEGLQGSTTSWDKEIDPIDKELLLTYSASPRFF